ncbi:MAG: hypothetical protein IKT08_07605 [Bacteroidales bacterium]|nr:hypothetical protein [Bacteroidales bacterium]
MISQEKKAEIAAKLNEKLTEITCPMCHQHNFIIADGYFVNILHENLDSFKLGGSSIPTISIICSNCGFVSQHALGVLGLLPEKKENDTESDKKQ